MIDKDFVQTPKEITKALLNNEIFEGTILEPCAGKGAISKVLEEKGYNVISSDKYNYGYCEVKDLFDIKEEYDNIITNPPFTKGYTEIKKHLFSLTKKKLALLWYVKRAGAELEHATVKNLKNIYIVGKVDWKEIKLGWQFAWYVWEKGYKGDVVVKRV